MPFKIMAAITICSDFGAPQIKSATVSTLDEGYLLTADVPDLQRGVAPLRPLVPAQPQLLGMLLPAAGPGLGRGWLLPGPAPGLRLGVAPQGARYPSSKVRSSGCALLEQP